jgi:hypothetical protein
MYNTLTHTSSAPSLLVRAICAIITQGLFQSTDPLRYAFLYHHFTVLSVPPEPLPN